MTRVLGGETSGAFNAPARARIRRRAASLRSTPPGSREPILYSTVTRARRLIDSLDAISVFEAVVVDGCAYVRMERRIEGLVLRTDNLVICIGEGTPC